MWTGLKLVPSSSCSLGGSTSMPEVSVPTARAPFSSTSHLAPETVSPAESGLAISSLLAPTPSPLSHTPAVPVRTRTTSKGSIYVHALLVERLLEPVRADPEALGERVLPDAASHVDHC